MGARRPFVGGNWKMNLHRAEATELAGNLARRLSGIEGVDVAVCPPFPYLAPVSEALAGGPVRLGAQDAYPEPNGAFTGEVSLSMLQDVGAGVVLAGHSERRHEIGEGDLLVNRKVRAALEAGMEVILCVGETLAQREAGQTHAINAAQLFYGLAGVGGEAIKRVTIAYEPVWAIGTGHTATPDDAQSAHAAIREALGRLAGESVAKRTRIQYGGSVKPSNAGEIFAQPDVDGGLIGGASLKEDDFVAIVEAAVG